MAEPYSGELADRICDLVSDGTSLRAACEKLGLERRTVRSWITRHREFAEAYDSARKLAIDGHVDGILELAASVGGTDSNAQVQAARLQIDSIRWLAAKLLPERFGDKIETKNETTLNTVDPLTALLREIASSGERIYDPRPK
jgi:hypothetical protein